MEKILDFKISKSEYIRLNQILRLLCSKTSLSEIHELNSIVTSVELRTMQSAIDDYFSNNRKKR